MIQLHAFTRFCGAKERSSDSTTPSTDHFVPPSLNQHDET